jgi:small-conductance mechanosensitive channel
MKTQSAVHFRIPRDVWLGLGGICFAGAYWWSADRIPISPLDGAVNAGMIPKALAYLLIGFCAIMMLRALAVEALFLRAARAARSDTVPERPREAGAHYFSLVQHLKAAGVIVIGIAYLLVLPWLGYVLSVILVIMAMSIYIGAKASLYTAGVALGIAVIFYGLFVQILGIPLPAGFWPSLFG